VSLTILLVRLALAAVFAVAAAGKMMDLAGSRKALGDFGFGPRLAALGGPALPALELLIAAALVVTPTARWGAVTALVLLGAFIVGIARLLRAGQAPDCHCFGQIHSEPVGASTLIRNAVLAAAALVVVVGAPGRSLAWFSGEGLALLLTAMATVALTLAAVILVRENRELQKRPQRGQRRQLSGLPKGSPAPEFRLPDVRGGEVALSEQLDAGRPVVIAFVSPHCGPCKTLLPDLARWQRTVSEAVTVLAVSDGDLEPNTALADEAGIGSLLVAGQARISAQYDVAATPSAVLVDVDGTVATAAAVGAPAIEALVRIALRRRGAAPLAPAALALSVHQA
jgi:peroxiredoxin